MDDNNNNACGSNASDVYTDLKDFFASPLFVVNMINGEVNFPDYICFVKFSALTIRKRDVMYSSDNFIFGL